MKQFIKFSTFAVLALTLFTITSCGKIPIEIPYSPPGFTIEITVPTVGGTNPAGTKVFSKDQIDNAVTNFLKDKGVATTSISSIDLTSLTAEIGAGSTLDFGDVTSGAFNLGGVDVATITSPPAGKTASYKIINANVLTAMLAPKTSYSLSITTNKATPAATLTIKYGLKITYKA
jgi:hypothetical protein